MTTIQTLPNSVWPNGLKRDEEGYVNFYPLGTNKVDISTITWPEGTEVKSPFVYQDDKLVGFVDTKALEIDNNDTTIDINYTHFDADLDSIMENTLTINAPANAAVNVKYGAVDKVLTEKIEKLIGKGKCEVRFDKDNNKATIAVALDTTEAQLADVESLLTRVLPSNLETEIEWADGLPTSYTRLEYLESTGTQYINTDIVVTNDLEIRGEFQKTQTEYIRSNFIFGAKKDGSYYSGLFLSHPLNDLTHYGLVWGTVQVAGHVSDGHTSKISFSAKKDKLQFDSNVVTIDGETSLDYPIYLFTTNRDTSVLVGHTFTRIYSFSISRNGQLQCNYIPALNGTGTPGMYDTVNKVFKTNMGTGDFIYPTDAAPAISAGLDETFYAKLTEHGIRRLYHVPNGCTMTKDEYAAANGFKELVEPPMPLEGYWRPEWRETETQLICDWVETEPPTEEV